jgi:serine/threonine protein kinase/tetratricopeptide (TPR) repeat protein
MSERRDDSVSGPSPAATATAPDFVGARSRRRELVGEPCAGWEAGQPVRPEELVPHWPGDPEADADVASRLFEEYWQRLQRGEEPSTTEFSQHCPEHTDSLDGLIHRHSLLRSLDGASGGSGPTLTLPEVGDELFGFRTRHELGRGAFARVFLAEQTALASRPVVLKVSAIDGHEPQTLAQLQHTHIVPIYSVHEDAQAGLRVVCMPYFGGASLSRVLQALWGGDDPPTRGSQLVQALSVVRCPLSVDRDSASQTADEGQGTTDNGPLALLSAGSYVRAAVWIVARLAEALEHAHQRGVLHRDIKPSNILVSAEGLPMLLDFNLAQNLNSGQAQAAATLGGTVAYMAPEHLRAVAARDPALARQVDQRADLYSLGMVLYEMLTGHSPFDHSASYTPIPALIEALAVERSKVVPSVRRQRPDVPWSLESILRKCLAPDPGRRYQRAEDVAEDLRRYLEDRPLRYAPELSWTERARKWVRRHPRLASSGSVATAAVLLLAGSGAALVGVQNQLGAAQARERKQLFQKQAVEALCLLNTTVDVHDQLGPGLRSCTQTLALYGVLDRSDWQEDPAWRRLGADDRRGLAEDTRELLLVLARARVQAAPAEADLTLPRTVAAFLAPAAPAAPALDTVVAAAAGCTVWEPKVGPLRQACAAAAREAVALLERADAIRDLPPSPALWEDRAFYLDLLGETARAAAARQRARETPPAGARDHYLLGTGYVQKGQYAEAVQELNRALRHNPRHYWSYLQLGICHQELGELALAAADFGACIGLWPDLAWGYFNRGRVFDQLGKKAEAVADYTAALACDPRLVVAYLNRGLSYLELNQPARALADFSAEAVRDRDDAALHGGRGIALEALGRHAEADAAFQRAFARAGQEVRLLLGYGFAVYRRRPQAAREAFDTVLRQKPGHLQALYGRGMVLAELKQPGEAVAAFEEALSADPGFVAARRCRAVLLARREDWVRACQDVNECLRIEPWAGSTWYTAACVAALAAEKAPNPLAAQLAADQALAHLQEAFARGYGQDQAAGDPDLAGLRGRRGFQRLLEEALNPPPATAARPR